MTFVIIDRNILKESIFHSNRLKRIDDIYNILVQCNPPYTFIERCKKIHCSFLTEHEIKQTLNYFDFDSLHFIPEDYITNLLDVKAPIDLYIFSQNFYGCFTSVHTKSDRRSIKKCQQMLNNIQIRNLKLYFIGEPYKINLDFIFIFQKFSQDIYINFEFKGHISPNFDFKDIDYAFLMKDDSIKLHILLKLFLNDTHRNVLRETLYQSYLRISKEIFVNDKIYPFYVENNVQDCVQFIQKYSNDLIQMQFRSRMYNIIRLLRFSLRSLRTGYVLENDKRFRYNIHSKIECKLIPLDILYTNNETMVFPIQFSKLYLFEKVLNLGKVFSFIDIIAEIDNNSFIMENIFNPESYQFFKEMYNINPTENEETLQNVYILNNGILPFQTVIKHNNAILSKLFSHIMKTDENIILWHMAFLYILGMNKFPEMKDRLFQEIRLLGDSTEYFISLHEHGNPLIIDKINAGFWYIAKISDLAFPHSLNYFCNYKLYLLDFYKNVYDPNYTYLPDIILNHLQNEFDVKYSILNTLSHFYEYENMLPNYSYHGFSDIILYNKPKKKLPSCLSSVNLETILERYQLRCGIEKNQRIKKLNIVCDSSKDKLDLVPLTELLFVKNNCLSLGFDIDVDDYLKIFNAYCVTEERFPTNSWELLSFINQYFWRTTKMPVLFEPTVKNALKKLLLISAYLMNEMQVCNYLLQCHENTKSKNSDEELLEFSDLI